MPPPVLLIHGFVCDSRFWEPQIAALQATGYAAEAPDLPYHGGPTEGVAKSLPGLAAWVAGTCEPSTVLIGHSLGGMIALQVVHDHPEFVAGIVLVDGFASLELNAQYLGRMHVDRPYDEVRVWIEETRDAILRRMTEEVHDTIWPSVVRFDARPWLPEITCPLLGIYGGRGEYAASDAPRLRSELMLDQVAGPSEVVVVPEAGHFVANEYPDEVNAALLEWLERLGT